MIEKIDFILYLKAGLSYWRLNSSPCSSNFCCETFSLAMHYKNAYVAITL